MNHCGKSKCLRFLIVDMDTMDSLNSPGSFAESDIYITQTLPPVYFKDFLPFESHNFLR